MQIRKVETIVVGNPWKNWVFVKLTTDESLEGIGEATKGLFTKPVVGAIEEISDFCIGEDPTRIEHIWNKVYKALYLAEEPTILGAMCGIEMACWDILGKSLDVPVYRLLGGSVRERLRAYANGWYQGPRDPSFFADRAKEVAESGYTALKFDPFGNAYRTLDNAELKKSMAIVEAVRRSLKPETDIIIEAHDRFSVSTAIRVGRALEEYQPLWYEAPVLSSNVDALQAVAEGVSVPVAAGERFATVRDFGRLLNRDIIDFILPEPLRVGGILRTKSICSMADAYGAQIAIHNAQSPLCTAVNTHIGLSTPNVFIQECFDDFNQPWVADVVRSPARVVNGYLELDDRPGLGVELNEQEAAKYPYGKQNFLRLFDAGWERRRSDDT